MEQVRDFVVRAATAATRDERIEAYGRLVEQFRDMACGYAYSILSDFHLAEDVAQEAFIVAFERLGQLEQPDAFPGWFRRIVWSCCGRMTRRKSVPTVGLEAADSLRSESDGPAWHVEQKEMRDQVLKAIRELPEPEREVTTLFYINGYSQRDIADFLEVPVGTVKNRLTASRDRLKERMMNMVEKTLHQSAPDERFNKKVIDELLSRPRPMEITGHPIQDAFKAICAVLPGYEIIEGEEIIPSSGIVNPWCRQFAYQLDEGRSLRTETTSATFDAARGRQAPVRLLTAGRVFRSDKEDATHLKVFHQVDVLCIEAGADAEAMGAVLQKVLEAVVGPTELQYRNATFHWFDPAHEVAILLAGEWRSVAGCGIMTPQTLRELQQNPTSVGGFAFGLGLERLAMLKYGIDDIRKLWQPPYVT